MEFYSKKAGWFLSGVHLHKNTVSRKKRQCSWSVVHLHGKRKGTFLKRKKVLFHKGEPPCIAVIMTVGWGGFLSLFFFFFLSFSSTDG